jgi:hypothetical protein
MTGRRIALLTVGAALAAAPVVVRGRGAEPPLRESRPGLSADASVRPDSARRLALRRYPGAVVASEMLRERGQRMTYVFTLRMDATGRTLEVLVDAGNGRVIAVPQESLRAVSAGATD